MENLDDLSYVRSLDNDGEGEGGGVCVETRTVC